MSINLSLFILCVHHTVSPSDRPDSFALGSETRASGDGSHAAELRGRREHPGQPGDHCPDVCIREGPHTHCKAAAGEEPV